MTSDKKAGSRRDRHALRAEGLSRGGVRVGPENLLRSQYVVEIVFLCKSDGTEMGRARRFTDPSLDGRIETTVIPGTGLLPRDAGEHAKWRFLCIECGHNVLMRDDLVEMRMDAITVPWGHLTKEAWI